MDSHNITLSLPRALLERAVRLATARLVNERVRFSIARRRSFNAMKTAASVGTRGVARWTRADLHERVSSPFRP